MKKMTCTCPKCLFQHKEKGFGEVTCLACLAAERFTNFDAGTWETSTKRPPGLIWSLIEVDDLDNPREKNFCWVAIYNGCLVAKITLFNGKVNTLVWFPRLKAIKASSLKEATGKIRDLFPRVNF
jgi:hypothetical protein